MKFHYSIEIKEKIKDFIIKKINLYYLILYSSNQFLIYLNKNLIMINLNIKNNK